MEYIDGGVDPDKGFAYDTKQQVDIKDRYLGITFYTINMLVMGYICIGIIYWSRGYLEFEFARGAIATHVRGDAYAVSSGKPGGRYFSAEDLTYPGLENGNLFISSRQTLHRQKRGVCEDQTMPCDTSDDCTPGLDGKCSDDGFCIEKGWCNEKGKPEIYELDVGNFNIWVKSSIQFVKLAPSTIYSTETNHPYPEQGYNVFSVRDLLMMAEPVPVRYEEIAELGAAVETQFVWDCDVSRPICKPKVKVRRIDVLFDENNIGFAVDYAYKISDEERMLIRARGVRIYIRSVGEGRAFSLNALIMKISTSMTLLSLAPILADLIMLKLTKNAKKFEARKFEASPDLSDFFEAQEKKDQMSLINPANLEAEDEEATARHKQFQQAIDEDD